MTIAFNILQSIITAMKGTITIALAIALAGLVYPIATSPAQFPERLRLKTSAPIGDVNTCVENYGEKAIPGLERWGAGDPINVSGRPRPPGATYIARDGRTKVTLVPHGSTSEIIVASRSPLSTQQAALFEACATKPAWPFEPIS